MTSHGASDGLVQNCAEPEDGVQDLSQHLKTLLAVLVCASP
jgi:hypothetical protein